MKGKNRTFFRFVDLGQRFFMVTDPTKVTPFVVILSDKVYYWQYGIKRDAIAADCFITKKYHKIV